jgi:hypothetical protein
MDGQQVVGTGFGVTMLVNSFYRCQEIGYCAAKISKES